MFVIINYFILYLLQTAMTKKLNNVLRLKMLLNIDYEKKRPRARDFKLCDNDYNIYQIYFYF